MAVPLLRRNWLLAGLLAAVAYAAFFSGAIAVPEESRLQAGIAALVLAAGAGLAAGALTPPRAAGLAWAGVALLALLGIWSAASVEWSVLPDASWLAANRALAYAAVAALALVAAASAPRAPRLAALGLAGLSLAVALYALGGKLAPGAGLLGVGLDHAAELSRLRAPIEYWNALGLFVVMASPCCLWLAADPERRRSPRLGALLTLALLLVTAGFTYSRGAFLAYLAVVAVMVAAGPQRLRRLGAAAVALLAAVPPLAFGLTRHDLTTDNLPVAARADDGALLALVLAASLVALAAGGWAAIAAERRVAWGPERARSAWRALAGGLAALAAAALLAAAASDRGLGGTVSHRWQELTRAKGNGTTDPGRLLSANGSNRWVWWGEALGAFRDRPVRGWGAGSFPVVHRLYRDNRLEVRQPHSLPLQLLAETGAVGGALGLGGLGLLGAAAALGVRRAAAGERSLRLALAAAAAAWAVHSLYDWDWDIPAVTLPALIAAAVAAAPWRPPAGEPRPAGAGAAHPAPGRAPRAAPAALLTLAAAALALALALSALLPALSEDRRLAALRTAERAGGAAGDAGLERAAAQAELARRLNPLSVEPLFASATIAGRRGRLREALELLARAARLQPDNVRSWRRLLLFQLGVGESRLVERAVREAARADPYGGDAETVGALALLVTSPYRSPTATGTPLPPLARP